MDWYQPHVRDIHVLLAWLSVTIFLVRGLAFQFSLEWALDERLRIFVFVIDTLMTVTGLSLWAWLHDSLIRDTWLTEKLLALVVYTVCAHWAMGRGEFSLLGYLIALIALAVMMAASMTHSPYLGL